ncbi:MAG: hypothetical protein MJ246_02625 [Clostridia bacterium]|nr:hypothetical protein [Clostridia bacterium]
MNKSSISKMIEDTIAEEEKRLDDIYEDKKSHFDEIDEKKNKLVMFRRKIKRSFFAGFGCGLMVIALVLYFFRPFTTVVETAPQLNDPEMPQITDEQVIEKAKALGMVMPTEITPAEIEVTPIDNSVK